MKIEKKNSTQYYNILLALIDALLLYTEYIPTDAGDDDRIDSAYVHSR